MFSKKQDERHQLSAHLRRICDLTSPNLPRLDEHRAHDRQNRIIPVLLTPWEDGSPVGADSVTALTKDICDGGISVTLPCPFRVGEVAVGFWLPREDEFDAWFFLGMARQNVPIGGGFWGLGIETIRFLRSSEVEDITPLVEKRLPPRKCESQPATALIAD